MSTAKFTTKEMRNHVRAPNRTIAWDEASTAMINWAADVIDAANDVAIESERLRALTQQQAEEISILKEKYSIALNRIANFEDMVAEYKQQLASLKEEPKWKVQAEVLWSMALILENEIKDESKNALFRSGVQVSIAKLKTTAQMLMDFQEDYKWNAKTVMGPSSK